MKEKLSEAGDQQRLLLDASTLKDWIASVESLDKELDNERSENVFLSSLVSETF
jgi:hypothetical protein